MSIWERSPMRLGPDISEQASRACHDLRLGVPVAISMGGKSAVAAAAENIAGERLKALRALGEQPVVAITARRAQTLKLPAYDMDIARVILPESAGSEWIQAIGDPSRDLAGPPKSPLETQRGGGAEIHRAAIGLLKQARLLPAALLAETPDGEEFAARNGLCHLEMPESPEFAGRAPALALAARSKLFIKAAGECQLSVFRVMGSDEEHCALEIGAPERSGSIMCRLHSACFTGDVLGSLKCDCGPQLNDALRIISKEGGGALLYLNQEGRGIGLANKMRAYSLQDQGFDTVEANHRLGFEDDERDFRVGSSMLRALGYSSVRLLTNNPAKVRMLRLQGVEVSERVPLPPRRNERNAAYLETKARKSGHVL